MYSLINISLALALSGLSTNIESKSNQIFEVRFGVEQGIVCNECIYQQIQAIGEELIPKGNVEAVSSHSSEKIIEFEINTSGTLIRRILQLDWTFGIELQVLV